MPSAINALDVPLAALAVYLLKQWMTPRPIVPLPPGPKAFPLIGNLLDWPKEKTWETFTRWGELYGGLTYCNLAGQPVVIINDASLAIALLDGKGSLYSDRPTMKMAGELVGWDGSTTLKQYTEEHKTMRALFAKTIGTRAGMDRFGPMEEEETQKFLRRVMDEPSRLAAHVRKLAGSIILNVAYGYQVQEGDDPMVHLADRFMDDFSATTTPGAFLVDTIPALEKLPDWFPGTGYRKVAAVMRKTCEESLNTPWDYVKQQLAQGTARPSFASSVADKEGITPEEEHLLKWTAVTMYGGGADTTVSSIYAFFLAMTLYPAVQSRAQAELDAVLGPHHLPTLADRPRLPYIDALMKEVLRWGLVVPTGVAHAVREDDVHAGYFIPKGTIVVPNIWKFTHDAAMYPDPDVFRPERFLAAPGRTVEPDPKQFVFGFGRRICPGLLLADSSVWLACAMSLSALQVRCATNAEGKDILPEVDFVGNLITHPKEFDCAIKPRSARMEALVREVAETSA